MNEYFPDDPSSHENQRAGAGAVPYLVQYTFVIEPKWFVLHAVDSLQDFLIGGDLDELHRTSGGKWNLVRRPTGDHDELSRMVGESFDGLLIEDDIVASLLRDELIVERDRRAESSYHSFQRPLAGAGRRAGSRSWAPR